MAGVRDAPNPSISAFVYYALPKRHIVFQRTKELEVLFTCYLKASP